MTNTKSLAPIHVTVADIAARVRRDPSNVAQLVRQWHKAGRGNIQRHSVGRGYYLIPAATADELVRQWHELRVVGRPPAEKFTRKRRIK